MKRNHIIVLSMVLSLNLSMGYGQDHHDDDYIRLGGWDYHWMNEVKESVKDSGSAFIPALEKLITKADRTLEEGVYSVTYKHMVPPSGSKHDYMSMGPYWWPDPDQPDGLPYIRRDGEVNPERNNLDSPRKSQMINSVRTLSLAWYFSDKIKYAEKAAVLLDAWFLDPETLMNPNLKYGQSIPGRTEGRFIGIIDTRSLSVLVDAIALLETSGALSHEQKAGLRNWFEDYFHWLTESEFGKEEENYKNNHSVAFDVQACGIAYFLGKDDYVVRKVNEIPHRRIDPMIEKDGSQPHELIRTKAYGYSVANLSNFFDVGAIGLKEEVDIFHYTNPKGGSLRKALDYLIGYIGHENDWPYEQISRWEDTENRLGLLVRRASRIYEDKKYETFWEHTFEDRLKENWNMLVVPSL